MPFSDFQTLITRAWPSSLPQFRPFQIVFVQWQNQLILRHHHPTTTIFSFFLLQDPPCEDVIKVSYSLRDILNLKVEIGT